MVDHWVSNVNLAIHGEVVNGKVVDINENGNDASAFYTAENHDKRSIALYQLIVDFFIEPDSLVHKWVLLSHNCAHNRGDHIIPLLEQFTTGASFIYYKPNMLMSKKQLHMKLSLMTDAFLESRRTSDSQASTTRFDPPKMFQTHVRYVPSSVMFCTISNHNVALMLRNSWLKRTLEQSSDTERSTKLTCD